MHLLKLLRSTRLSVSLFAALALLMLLGLVIPQKSLLAPAGLYEPWRVESPSLVGFLETLGLTELYTSPLLMGAWALFFLNLTFVMADRAGALRNRVALPAPEALPRPEAMRTRATVPGDAETLEAWAGRLRAMGFQLVSAPGALYAVKHRFSPLATLVFHLSFFLVLTGVILSGWTRFSATALLTEGETFSGAEGPYATRPALAALGRFPGVRFVVEEVISKVESGTAVDIQATVRDERGARHLAQVNHPYKADNTSFVVLDLGVAPLLVLTNPAGREVDGAYIKLLAGRPNLEPFFLGGLRMEGAFFTHFSEEENRPVNLSKEFKAPVVLLRVSSGADAAPLEKALRPGESLSGPWGTVTFREFRKAIKFFIRRERGVSLVYGGFLLACAALIWRLWFYRREVVVSLGEALDGSPLLLVGGRSEYYQSLFEEEFEALVARLRNTRDPLAERSPLDGGAP